MTRDDIIRVMREVLGTESDGLSVNEELLEEVLPFLQAVAAAEREACAVLCEQQKDMWVDGSDQWGNPCPARLRVTPSSCAAAIRARGQA
ncbi:MAG: hypothetical protein RLZZ09_3260 [Pseudomonadota bacterium]|jgi:hypothetical protein